MTRPDRLRAALAELVDRAHVELPHVVIGADDDPRLVVGCLLGWVGFQQLREPGLPYGLAQDWEYLARCHAVALGRLAKARTDLARLSADGDDVDLYEALFVWTAPPRRRVLAFSMDHRRADVGPSPPRRTECSAPRRHPRPTSSATSSA